MGSVGIAMLVLSCVFGAALLGMRVQGLLPDHHLRAESKDVIKLGIGLIATMAALLLSLLISSAKSSYDAQSRELRDVAANIILLDRVLEHYGPKTIAARTVLRDIVAHALNQVSQGTGSVLTSATPTARTERLSDEIQVLSPASEAQRLLRAQALTLVTDMTKTRWLLFEQRDGAIPMPLLLVLTLWLAIIFASFGLYAPTNATVVATFFVCAVSVACAILLVLELDRPFGGVIRMSTAPLTNALMLITP